MDDADKKESNTIKGKYTQKYGQQVDEWTGMVLQEIDENFTRLSQKVQDSVQAINNAATAIKGKHRLVQFKDKMHALYYGLGASLPLAVTGIVISILIFWFSSTTEAYKSRRRIIDTYGNAPDYILLIENGEIIEDKGANYLVLKATNGKGDIIIGKEYIYDARKKQVLVPLGRK